MTDNGGNRTDDWKNRFENCKNTSKENKQIFLNLLHEGKSIGEAKDVISVDLYTACEIINENIGSYEFLRRTPI